MIVLMPTRIDKPCRHYRVDRSNGRLVSAHEGRHRPQHRLGSDEASSRRSMGSGLSQKTVASLRAWESTRTACRPIFAQHPTTAEKRHRPEFDCGPALDIIKCSALSVGSWSRITPSQT